jgi:hypothetical protein
MSINRWSWSHRQTGGNGCSSYTVVAMKLRKEFTSGSTYSLEERGDDQKGQGTENRV